MEGQFDIISFPLSKSITIRLSDFHIIPFVEGEFGSILCRARKRTLHSLIEVFGGL